MQVEEALKNSFTKRIWHATRGGAFAFNSDWLRNEIGGWAFVFNFFHLRIVGWICNPFPLRIWKKSQHYKREERQPHKENDKSQEKIKRRAAAASFEQNREQQE